MSETTYAQAVTRLARQYHLATPADGVISTEDYVDIVNRLHAAADRAGISRKNAALDLIDEIKAPAVQV